MVAAETNPFVGPLPFRRQDEERFFGRDREANELASRVIAHSETVLYSQSGAGKTSLINARLIPLLESKGCEVLPLARVQGPVQGIDPAAIRNIYAFHTLMCWTEQDADPRVLANLTLADYLKDRKHPIDDETMSSPHVAVFDQFEELFTFYPDRWRERHGFFEQLRDALKADPQLRFVIAMREDHVAKLDTHAALLPEKMRNRLRLERLKERNALLAVREPTRQTPRRFADGVAERLVEDLMRTTVDAGDQKTISIQEEYVEPVQLQVVCRGLWDSLPSGTTEITFQHLEASANPDDSLGHYYEKVLRQAVEKHGVAEGTIRRWFEKGLITTAGTRAMLFRGPTETGGLPNPVVDLLEDLHLIRAEMKAGARWYELTHDRFLEPIRVSNRRWRGGMQLADQNRQQLEKRATDWTQSGSGVLLLNKEELADAEGWLLTPQATEVGYDQALVKPFIAASKQSVETANREQERIKERADAAGRFRKVSIGLAALLVVSVGLGAALIWEDRIRSEDSLKSSLADAKAKIQSENAEKWKLLFDRWGEMTKIQKDIEDVKKEYKSNPAVNMKKASDAADDIKRTLAGKRQLEGVKIPGFKIALTSFQEKIDGNLAKAEATLRQVVTAMNADHVLTAHTKPVNLVRCSADGRLLYSFGGDQTLLVWDARTRQDPKKYDAIERSGNIDLSKILPGVVISADGQAFLFARKTRQDDATARIATAGVAAGIAAVTVPSTPQKNPQEPKTADAHEQRAKPTSEPDSVDEKTKKQICLVRVQKDLSFSEQTWDAPDNVVSMDVSNGSHTAVLGDKKGQIWLLQPGKKSAEFNKHEGLQGVFISPDAKFLVTTSSAWDKRLFLWKAGLAAGPTVLKPMTASLQLDRVLWVTFSGDGKYFAAYDVLGLTVVWETATGQPVRDFRFPYTTWIEFSPHGQKLAIASSRKIPSEAGYTDQGVAQVLDVKSGTFIGRQIQGHSDRITGLAFSADEKLLATASQDQTARIWDVATGGFRQELRGHGGAVTTIAFSSDGATVITGSSDKTVRLWSVSADAADHVDLKLPKTAGLALTSGNFSRSGNLVVLGCSDGVARIWDRDTGAIVKELAGHSGRVRSAAFSNAEDGHVLTLCADNVARVWNSRTGALIAELAHAAPVLNAAFHPSHQDRVLTASSDLTARIWDVTTAKEMLALGKHRAPLSGAAFSPCGAFVVTATKDNQVHVWDANTGVQVGRSRTGFTTQVVPEMFGGKDSELLAVPQAGVFRATGTAGHALLWATDNPTKPVKILTETFSGTALFSPDGKMLAMAADDGNVLLWSAESFAEPRVLVGHTSPVDLMSFSPKGDRLATEAKDTLGMIWDVATGKRLATLPDLSAPVAGITFNHDGTRVAAPTGNNVARVWDAATGAELLTLKGHAGAIVAIAFSPDGRWIATASQDQTVLLWDAPNGNPRGELLGALGIVNSLAFATDSKRLVTCANDSSVRLWNPETRLPVLEFAEFGLYTRAAFEPDGKSLILASAARQVRGLAAGQPTVPQPSYTGVWDRVAFDPQLDWVLTVNRDQHAAVWDARTGKKKADLKGQVNGLFSAAFSPDGQKVVTVGNADNFATVWNSATGERIGGELRHQGFVNNCVFTSDGKRIITGGDDKVAQIWDLASGKPLGTPLAHKLGVDHVGFTPDDTVAFTTSGGLIQFWDVATGTKRKEEIDLKNPIYGIAFSPDGKHLAICSSDRKTTVWHWPGATLGKTVAGHNGGILSVAFSSDGTLLATAGYDRRVQVWERDTGKSVLQLEGGHDGRVNRVEFSHDGKRIVTAGADMTVRVWDVNTGRALSVLREHQGEVRQVRFSADDSQVFTAGVDDRFFMWDWQSKKSAPLLGASKVLGGGQALADVTASRDGKFAVATFGYLEQKAEGGASWAKVWRTAKKDFTPDNADPMRVGPAVAFAAFVPLDAQWLLTLEAGSSVPILMDWKEDQRFPLFGHAGTVTKTVFSADGKFLLTVSIDGTARLWDVATRQTLATLAGTDGKRVTSAAFSPDNQSILVITEDQVARIQAVPYCGPLETLMSLAKSRLQSSPRVKAQPVQKR